MSWEESEAFEEEAEAVLMQWRNEKLAFLLTCVRSPPKANHLIFGNGLPSKVQESSVVVPVRPEPLVTATCLGAAAKNKKRWQKTFIVEHGTHFGLEESSLNLKHDRYDKKSIINLVHTI